MPIYRVVFTRARLVEPGPSRWTVEVRSPKPHPRAEIIEAAKRPLIDHLVMAGALPQGAKRPARWSVSGVWERQPSPCDDVCTDNHAHEGRWTRKES